jgi:hypothetical protein
MTDPETERQTIERSAEERDKRLLVIAQKQATNTIREFLYDLHDYLNRDAVTPDPTNGTRPRNGAQLLELAGMVLHLYDEAGEQGIYTMPEAGLSITSTFLAEKLARIIREATE